MVTLTNLFKTIEEKGLTKSQVAKDTGISSGNISDWQNGRSMPTAIKLDVLANYLSVSVDYLLGRTDNPNTIDGHSIKTGDINGNNNSLTDSNNINISKKPTDSISEKFMEIFNNLPFEEQLAVMNVAVEKSKKCKE